MHCGIYLRSGLYSSGRQPGGYKTECQHYDCNKQNISDLHRYRVGRNHIFRTRTQLEEPEMLLYEADQEPQDEPSDCSKCRDEPAFAGEDAAYLPVGGSKVGEYAYILLFIND